MMDSYMSALEDHVREIEQQQQHVLLVDGGVVAKGLTYAQAVSEQDKRLVAYLRKNLRGCVVLNDGVVEVWDPPQDTLAFHSEILAPFYELMVFDRTTVALKDRASGKVWMHINPKTGSFTTVEALFEASHEKVDAAFEFTLEAACRLFDWYLGRS